MSDFDRIIATARRDSRCVSGSETRAMADEIERLQGAYANAAASYAGICRTLDESSRKCIALEEQLARCQALLRQACRECDWNQIWTHTTMTREWFERAQRAAGGE